MKTIRRIKGPSLCLGILVLALTSCEGRQVPATLQFDRQFVFAFDSSAGLTRTAGITAADLLGALDLPSDAFIEEVDIQQLRMSLNVSPNNAASDATIAFRYLGYDAATSVIDVVDNPNAAVVAIAVDEIGRNARAMLRNDPSAPSQISITGAVSGIAPSGARLVLDAILYVTMTVTYYDCVSIGLGPLGPGAECTTFEEF